MRVRVFYHAQIRSVMGRTSEDFELDHGATALLLLARIADQHGDAIRAHLFASPNVIRPSLLLVLNNILLPHADAGDTPLQENDNLTLLPPIAGG